MMNNLRILLLFMLSHFCGYAQYPDWVNYTNGKNVQCLLNDGNFIWVGTMGGLVKMEKATGNCTFFTKTNSGIPSNSVTSLAKDTQGNIWMGTGGGGVAKFTGSSWTTYNEHLATNEPTMRVTAIASDSNGGIWALGGCVYHFLNNIWTKHTPSISMSGESMVIDQAGVVYIGSETNGLTRFDGTTWTNYNPTNSNLLNERIHDLSIDSQNNVWASSYNCGGPGGLSKFDGTNFTTHLIGEPIEKIAIDSNDNIWMNEYPFRLSKYDGNNLVTYDSSNSQVVNIAYDIMVDGSDIWFGTAYDQGLMKFDGISSVTPYNTSQTGISYMTNMTNKGLAIDSTGIIWIAPSMNGIDRLDQNGFTNLNMGNSGLPVPGVNSISVDYNNNLWMGSDDGIIKYDGTNFTHFDSASYNLIGSKVTHDLVFDGAGNVYCLFNGHNNSTGTLVGGGIMKYDGNSWTKINLSAIADIDIMLIAIDKQDQLWAAGIGIIEKHNLFNPVVFTSLNAPFQNNEHFTSLLVDGYNNIWLSSFDGEIFKIHNSSTISVYNVTPCSWMGMGDIILTMAIDINNNLWVSFMDMCSNNGMFMAKYDGTSFAYFDVNNCGLTGGATRITTSYNKICFLSTGLVVFTDPSLPSGVQQVADELSQLIVSPNPSSGEIRINITLKDDSPLTVEVVNLQGQVVYEQIEEHRVHGNHDLELNLGFLPNSIYLVRLKTESGYQQSRVSIVN